MRKVLEVQYARLCQELGDTEFKISKLKEHSENLKSQIKTLDNLTPQILETSKLPQLKEDGDDDRKK